MTAITAMALPHSGGVDESEVALEKTRLLFRNAGLAQAVTAINATILLYIYARFSPPLWAMLWWALAVAIAGGRIVLARAFFLAAPEAAAAPLWRRRALLGALIGGLAWAGGGTALMLSDPGTTRVFTALVMAGMVGGAVSILSAVPRAFDAYTVPVMTSIILTATLDAHGARDWMLALVAALFLGALLKSARHFHDSLDNSIRLALSMKRMAEQLDEARKGAEAASEAKTRFLTTMSHEIRTPLNGILGMAQVLLATETPEDKRQEYTRIILNSGQTLLTLLNDILDLSRVEANDLALSQARFDPALMLKETESLFLELARHKGLEFASNWRGPAGRQYRGDATRLRQMLGNLVSNAVKFTSQGRIYVQISEVGAGPAQATLEFSVSDTGIGIPENKRELLFRPFTQVDGSDTRKFGGTGLGLAIVNNLAQLMNGEVGVESAPGLGSRFWFRVPVDLQPTDAVQAREESSPPTSTGSRLTGHVLLVEDNEVNRKVVTAMLKRLGVTVTSVEDGLAAVEAVTTGPLPDLVLMDCQMPVMDGFQATERIRQWEARTGQGRLPIVALTAGAFESDRERCFTAGMDEFMAKPANMQKMAEVLGKWLPPSRQIPGLHAGTTAPL